MSSPPSAAPLIVEYVDADAVIYIPSEQILGAAFFGAPPAELSFPLAQVEMEPLLGGAFAELWIADRRCRRGREGRVDYSESGEVLFGTLELPEDGPLEAAAQEAYREALSFVRGSMYPNLFRMWNHFPSINATPGGLERYRRFCMGRHDGFLGAGFLGEGDLPAASGVGTDGGPLHVYFLTSRRSVRHVENPRQVSAFRYPQKYGPRSPSFARASVVEWDNETQVFISGTASIVGHESAHEGDLAAQLGETMENMKAVLGAATGGAAGDFRAAPNALFKVYVRRSDDASPLAAELARHIAPESRAVYLRADICREELLLEIEAVVRLS
jgi:chorismate lyase / 3-hydroxybenzoate synthase